MSKYIRTKDGKIFEYAGRERTPYGDLISANGTHYRYDCVLKEADTVEELCDEVVVKETWRDTSIVIQPGGCSDRFACARGLYLGKPTTENICGSIWVNGNLMKVAKMNDKGDLELIAD